MSVPDKAVACAADNGSGARWRSTKQLERQRTHGTKLLRAKLISTNDSFQNFAARLGIGTDNQSSESTYGFSPISRNRGLLEWMYRGSWICGKVVDCPADDMTRAGIEFTGGIGLEEIAVINADMNNRAVWSGINSTAKWGRLYGGPRSMRPIVGEAGDSS